MKLKFRKRKSQKKLGDQLVYIEEDAGFYVPSNEHAQSSIFINDLELSYDDKYMIISVDGFCPLYEYTEINVFPKNYEFYDLFVLLNEDDIGYHYRFNEERWLIYINSKQGWVCIGDPTLDGFTVVEFAPHCVATLDGNEPIAIWLHPKELPMLQTKPPVNSITLPFKRRQPKPRVNLYNPKYLIKMFGSSFVENDAACLGSQLRELFAFLTTLLPPHVWIGADIKSICIDETIFMNDPYHDFFLQKIGFTSDIEKQLHPVIQFESAVFFAIKEQSLTSDYYLFDIHTEDPEFRPLQVGDILIEIRAYKTDHYAVYSENQELMKKIAEKFQCNIEYCEEN